MHIRTFLSLVCLLLGLTACGGGGGGQPNPPGNKYTLSGTVRNAANAAIAGAQVLLGQSAAVTDNSGTFRFDSLPAGFYLASVQDAEGNFACKQLQLSASSTSFDFTLPVTTSGFEVVAVSPPLNSTSAGLNSDFRIEFSQPLDQSSIGDAADWFSPSLGNVSASTNGAGTVLVLDPELQLPLNQQITVEIPAAAASTAGVSLSHVVRWRCTTEATDTAAPQLITTTPLAGETAHPPNLSAVFEFNEALENNPLPSISVEPSTEMTATVSGRYLYVQPAGGWQTLTAYTLSISDIADGAGNVLGTSLGLSFTTSDQAAPAYDVEPAWNRVDNTIVFASDRYGSYDIYKVALDGNELVRLTALPGDERHPSVSRDGQRLVFQYRAPGGKWHIYSQRIDGEGEANQLTAGDYNDQQPVFSYTISDKIAFSSDRVEPSGIFMMNSDGSNLLEIDMQFGSEQTSPAFHPLLDTQMLFISNRSGSRDVWRKTISAIDGSTINLNLTGDYLSQESTPAFSPDAGYVLFVSDYSGVDELWVADADGAFPRQLTFFESDVADPALNPSAGSTECIISLPQSGGGRGLAVVDSVSGSLTSWLTGEEAHD